MLLSYFELTMKFTKVLIVPPMKDINGVFLDIPKAFGKACHEGLLLNCSFFEIIKKIT